MLAGGDAASMPGAEAAALLTVGDIAALDLAGAVVILSACSSGMQTLHRGDESSSIVSSLLRAGARTVIASQWPITDQSAMMLMVGLHDRLREDPAADLSRHLAESRKHLRSMTAADVIDHGLSLANRLGTLGGDTYEVLSVAGANMLQALQAAGETAGVTAVLGAMRRLKEANADAGLCTTELATLSESLRPLPVVRPFQYPRHWGAFTIVGAGYGERSGGHVEPAPADGVDV